MMVSTIAPFLQVVFMIWPFHETAVRDLPRHDDVQRGSDVVQGRFLESRQVGAAQDTNFEDAQNEHGPVEIVDFPMNSMVIFHSYGK